MSASIEWVQNIREKWCNLPIVEIRGDKDDALTGCKGRVVRHGYKGNVGYYQLSIDNSKGRRSKVVVPINRCKLFELFGQEVPPSAAADQLLCGLSGNSDNVDMSPSTRLVDSGGTAVASSSSARAANDLIYLSSSKSKPSSAANQTVARGKGSPVCLTDISPLTSTPSTRRVHSGGAAVASSSSARSANARNDLSSSKSKPASAAIQTVARGKGSPVCLTDMSPLTIRRSSRSAKAASSSSPIAANDLIYLSSSKSKPAPAANRNVARGNGSPVCPIDMSAPTNRYSVDRALNPIPKPIEAPGRSASRHQKCSHGRRKNICIQCKGSRICEHGRQKMHCHQCPRPACFCEHGKQRSRCTLCKS